MKLLFGVLVAGVAGMVVLGKIYQNQQSAAITACGGPLTAQLTSCPGWQTVEKNWAWLPRLQV